jgi:hypothetical protein
MIAGSPHTYLENRRMTESLNGIRAQLERQKTAIERALDALKSIEGIPAPASPVIAPAKRKGE